MITRRRRSLHTAAGRAAPLPTKVGNDIARTALPIMTEARTQHLAAHLRKGCPIPEEVVEPTVDVNEETKNASPLPNEDLTDAKNRDQSTSSKSRTSKGEDSDRRSSRLRVRATVPDSRSTTNDDRSSTNDNRSSIKDQRASINSRSTHHAPRSTNSPPIANGKSKEQATGKGKRKLVRKQWLQTVAKRVKT